MADFKKKESKGEKVETPIVPPAAVAARRYSCFLVLFFINSTFNRASAFNGDGLDQKKVAEMPVMAEEEEDGAVNGAANIEEELQMRELHIDQ